MNDGVYHCIVLRLRLESQLLSMDECIVYMLCLAGSKHFIVQPVLLVGGPCRICLTVRGSVWRDYAAVAGARLFRFTTSHLFFDVERERTSVSLLLMYTSSLRIDHCTFSLASQHSWRNCPIGLIFRFPTRSTLNGPDDYEYCAMYALVVYYSAISKRCAHTIWRMHQNRSTRPITSIVQRIRHVACAQSLGMTV